MSDLRDDQRMLVTTETPTQRRSRNRARQKATRRNALLALQGNYCAICRKPDPRSVDHDHAIDPRRSTRYIQQNAIRGLLCQWCNVLLQAVENANWLAAAQAYLADPPARRLP